MNRRSFLIRGLGLAIPLSLTLFFSLKGIPSYLKYFFTPSPPEGFSENDWRTLQAVLEHLLPSEPGSPGAEDIRALEYYRSLLSHDLTEGKERETFQVGLGEIETLALKTVNRSFTSLSEKQREAVLRSFEGTTRGKEWLTENLNYLFEALLGDPVYGGNPSGMAWEWLGHGPGFPRPPVGKRYYEL